MEEITTFYQLLDFIITEYNISENDSAFYRDKIKDLILDCTKRELLLHQIGSLSTLIMQFQIQSENSTEIPEEAKQYIDDYTKLIIELESTANNPLRN